MPLVQAALVGARKGLLARDSFDRPDDSGSLGAADSGQAWTQLYGAGGIVSSTARLTSDAAAYLELKRSDAEAECSILATVDEPIHPGLLFRAVNDTNFWYLELRFNSDLLRLVKRVANVDTVVFSESFALGINIRYKVRVKGAGPTIGVYMNDTLRSTVSDSAHQGATRHGLFQAGASSNNRWDDFRVTGAR